MLLIPLRWLSLHRCSVVYGFVQRPLSGSKKLQQVVWVNIARHAFVQTCLNLLWLYGLSQVGPLRAVLLSEHADIVVLAVWGAVLKGKTKIILLSLSLLNSVEQCVNHGHSRCIGYFIKVGISVSSSKL